MTYTKKEATILLAGMLKSIEKKWEPLASGKFRERVEPGCYLCRARDRAREVNHEWDDPYGCTGCPLIDSRGSTCNDYSHVYARWSVKICNLGEAGASFNRTVNNPTVVKSAGRVLISLRRAEKKLKKVVAK